MSQTYTITAFGAQPDAHTLNTKAIQSAIDTCFGSGGGTVVIPRGIFLCGALFMKQGVSLEVQKDAVLLGSQNIADYPVEPTRFEGRTCDWPVALLNAHNTEDLKIYGEGTIDGNGEPFWIQFWSERQTAIDDGKPFSNRDTMRPRLVFISDSHNVHITGIQLRCSGFWHLHLYNCDTVTVSDVKISSPHGSIRAPSSDGIDIDACSNVIIRNCDIDTDDDCICIKSGKGADAHTSNKPAKDILIEHCRFGFGHGAITIGSEAAVVRNVTVRDCHIYGENNAIRFKFRDDTNQAFENILFESITMKNSGWLFDIQPWISRQDEILAAGLPSYLRNLTVRNVKAENIKAPGVIKGIPESIEIDNVMLENIKLSTDKSLKDASPSRFDIHEHIESDVSPDSLPITGCRNVVMRNVSLNGRFLTHQ
jgi:polygalacturonase